MKSTREALLAQEKTIVTGDCCYLNPLMRRVVRFVGKTPPVPQVSGLRVHAAHAAFVSQGFLPLDFSPRTSSSTPARW